jgi:chromosome segregation ATPase
MVVAMSNDRVDELEMKLDTLITKKDNLQQKTEWLEDQLRAANKEIEQLQQEVSALEDDTGLLKAAEKSEARKPTKRAIVLIRTLRKRALNSDGYESLDVQGALDVLRLDKSKRTLMYDTFETAVELVEDRDVLWYRNEPRSSEKNSRLILDLENGDVPPRVKGFNLHTADD